MLELQIHVQAADGESDRTNQTTARAVFTNGLYGGQREGGETVIKVKMPRVFELVDL